MRIRHYDPRRDRDASHRIFHEVGWLGEHNQAKEEAADILIGCSRALVAEVKGEAECLVLAAPGTVRYLDDDLPISVITGVATSRITRRRGFASRLTARAIAADAAAGALLCELGVFEQGYYDRLGFGSGGYEIWAAFDPARLKVGAEPRVPRRITTSDWAIAHASRLARLRGHGALNLTRSGITRSEMMWTEEGFGLSYADGPDGELTHHIWCRRRRDGTRPLHGRLDGIPEPGPVPGIDGRTARPR